MFVFLSPPLPSAPPPSAHSGANCSQNWNGAKMLNRCHHHITWWMSSSSTSSSSSPSSHHMVDAIIITLNTVFRIITSYIGCSHNHHHWNHHITNNENVSNDAFFQDSKAAKMLKAQVSSTYCSHKVDSVSGPGAQKHNVCKENEKEDYKTCCVRNKQGAWLHIHGKHNVNKSS